MSHHLGRGRWPAPLGVLVCLLTLGAALASLCFAEEIDSPAHYDGDDDDAGIHQNRFTPEPPEPLLEGAVLAYLQDIQPVQWVGRLASDHLERPQLPFHRRPPPRGPPA